ncbi:hypothetical protein WMF39_03040 [Sorangium sp. So ce1504]|uniref:hypothetical protein n=1 Tax=Sorangium sp. So ce1504 TaxID=3133337 RepID=UPI003F5E4BAC
MMGRGGSLLRDLQQLPRFSDGWTFLDTDRVRIERDAARVDPDGAGGGVGEREAPAEVVARMYRMRFAERFDPDLTVSCGDRVDGLLVGSGVRAHGQDAELRKMRSFVL